MPAHGLVEVGPRLCCLWTQRKKYGGAVVSGDSAWPTATQQEQVLRLVLAARRVGQDVAPLQLHRPEVPDGGDIVDVVAADQTVILPHAVHLMEPAPAAPAARLAPVLYDGVPPHPACPSQERRFRIGT